MGAIRRRFGLVNEEEDARNQVRLMIKSAEKEENADLKKMTEARRAATAALNKIQDAVAALKVAKADAIEEAKKGWNTPEEEWDKNFSELASNVQKAADAVDEAELKLEAAGGVLTESCQAAEAAAAARAKKVQTVMETFSEEVQEKFADEVVHAVRPVNRGRAIRLWALARASATDVMKMEKTQSGLRLEMGDVLAAMRSAREWRRRLETSKKAAAEPPSSVKPAPAQNGKVEDTTTMKAQELANEGVGILVAAVVAVAVAFAGIYTLKVGNSPVNLAALAGTILQATAPVKSLGSETSAPPETPPSAGVSQAPSEESPLQVPKPSKGELLSLLDETDES